MNVKEAYKKITKRYPDMEVEQVINFDDMWVFYLVETLYKGTPIPGASYSVNKNDGLIKMFNPCTSETYLKKFIAAAAKNQVDRKEYIE